LSEQERAKISEALKQMARDPAGNPVDPTQGNVNNNSNKNVKETKTIKGAKEATIEIAALKGKGYPAPVDLNTGGAKPAKPLGANTGKNANTGNTNTSGQNKRF
jgi:hypothetical protein